MSALTDSQSLQAHGPRVGVGVVVCRGADVLVGLRAGSHACGEWAFPGGKVNHCEHPCQTADRELREESGLVCVNFRPVRYWCEERYGTEKHFITVFVACDWAGGEPERLEPRKCLEWRFVRWPEALPEPLMSGTRELARSGVDVFA